MIDDGHISQRKVGWFRINIDENPKMSAPGHDIDQIVMGKLGQRKFLNFQKESIFKLENEKHIVSILKELTGDFMTHIEC